MGKLAALDPHDQIGRGHGAGDLIGAGAVQIDGVKAVIPFQPLGDLGLVFQNARIARTAAIDEHPGQRPGRPAGIAIAGVPGAGQPRHDPGALLLCAGLTVAVIVQIVEQDKLVEMDIADAPGRQIQQPFVIRHMAAAHRGRGHRMARRFGQPIGQTIVQEPIAEPAVADPAFV